jgi:hypothetical protein
MYFVILYQEDMNPMNAHANDLTWTCAPSSLGVASTSTLTRGTVVVYNILINMSISINKEAKFQPIFFVWPPLTNFMIL